MVGRVVPKPPHIDALRPPARDQFLHAAFCFGHVALAKISCTVFVFFMWRFPIRHVALSPFAYLQKTGQNGHIGGKNRKGTHPEVLLLSLLGDLEISSLEEDPSNGRGTRPSVTSEARVGLE